MTSEIIERKCWVCGYIEKQPFSDSIKCPLCGTKNPWLAIGAMKMTKQKEEWNKGHNSFVSEAMKMGISSKDGWVLQDIKEGVRFYYKK